MFSIATGCCSAFSGVEDKKTTERLRKTLIADSVLTIIFSIIAVLGFSGVMPLAVGITFCVLGVLQMALSAVMKKGVSSMS